MKKILGLDLGVGSIGWALIYEDETGKVESHIIRMGVRTISYSTFVKTADGKTPQKHIDEFLKGVGLSSNAGRSKLHGMRIRLQRYKLRRKHLVKVLKANGFINEDTVLCEEGKNSTHKSYALRAAAVEREISLEDLAKVLLMINKKRGFKSNRKDEVADNGKKQSDYKEAINSRSQLLKEEGLTVGQWKYRKLAENPHTSLKNIIFYRQDYKDEFDRIWEVQSQFHPELTDDLKKEIGDIIIFHQRELKSQKGNISSCRFESYVKEVVVDPETGKKSMKSCGCKVSPKSSPLFQEFRIWHNLNNLLLSDFVSHTIEPLSLEDKETLFAKLSMSDKLTKNEALKLLKKKTSEYDLNFDKLEGNRTNSKILAIFEDWMNEEASKEYKFSKMNVSDIKSVLLPFMEEKGIPVEILEFDSSLPGKELERQLSYKFWHLLYSYKSDSSRSGDVRLIEKLQSDFNFPEEIARRVANLRFEDDYAGLSAKAMRKLLPFMRQGLTYDKACEKVGYNHSDSLTAEENEKRELKEFLDLVPRNSLRNPVVEKILNQMANVVNAIILEYGKPDEVRIELARELKKTSAQRQKMTEAIGKAEKENERIRKIISQEPYNIANPSKNDIVKYKLYEELKNNGYKTLYTNTYIEPSELFDAKFNIEHIIPKAKLFNDSYSNKTLETSSANKDKGARTAMDYVETLGEEAVDKYKATVENLFRNKEISKAKRDFLLMKESDIPSDFLNRDLSETQYIAKEATSMLKAVIRNVSTTTGSITKRLRDDWGLVDVMKELNWDKYDRIGQTEIVQNKDGRKIRRIKNWTKRNDHRHHAIDALVIALTRPVYVQYLNNMASSNDVNSNAYAIRKKYLRTDDGHLKFISPISNIRSEAEKHLSGILISIKAKGKVATKSVNKVGKNRQNTLTPRGQLHDQTVYGKTLKPVAEYVKVDGKMTQERIDAVTSPLYRKLLQERLDAFGGDSKKAFTGKNSLAKKPIWIDEPNEISVPDKVKIVTFKEVYSVRKNVDSNINISAVADPKIRKILQARLDEEDGNKNKAFSDLENNPIWLNPEQGVAIKKVKTVGTCNPIPIHDKLDNHGNPILDENGTPVPADYVNTNGNHHAAIYIDPDGKLYERVVSFFEAVERKNQGLSVIDKEYNSELGWKLLFSLKINEYFVFPDPESDFYPSQVDLTDLQYSELISKNLFRVQAVSKGDYSFRHHLETQLIDDKSLVGITWKRVKSLSKLRDIVKVRINHIGNIVKVGE